MSALFKLKIITPEKIFFDGETEQVTLRTTEGDTGILAKHINYVASLPAGPLRVKTDKGFRVAALSDGMVEVNAEKTTIIANAIEWADEIDVNRAKQAEEDARQRLKIHESGLEFERADLKLKRALNRVYVSQNHNI